MRHLAAAILLALGGKPIDENGIKAVLNAGGVKVDDAQVTKIVNACKGKDVFQLCKEGFKSAPTAAPAKEDKKKEEKAAPKKAEVKVEEPEEDDGAAIGDLFG